MAKLHELLAVRGDLHNQAIKATQDLTNTFEKKRHLFEETIQTFKPNGENVPAVTEKQKDLQSTVGRELKWLRPFLTKAINASYSVDAANTVARADVILEDGTTLLMDVPATTLLELEKRMAELHTFVSAIPTLDPAKGFQADLQRGTDIFQAREEVTTRTAKIQRPLTLAPATDKHPAQVQLISEDVPTGTIHKQEWSGLITTTAKGLMLERVENLTRAVKQARSRANDQELLASPPKIGENLLAYVFGPQ